MPKRVERKGKPEFDRQAYLKGTKFASGINPEIAAREAEEIYEQGNKVSTHKYERTTPLKPTTKKEK